MKMQLRHCVGCLVLIAAGWSPCLGAGASERFWFGGGVGLGFGDVQFVAIEPIFGYRVTDELSVGLGLIYRYRDDDRFSPGLSSNDYGFNVFTRYRFTPRFYAHGEVEYLSYEFLRFDGTEERDSYTSVLAGPGYAQQVGRRSSVYVSTLYNFNYDGSQSPYDDPWTIRVGYAYGF